MLKLTRHLFEWQPSATEMDFYERALYNDILASQDPEEGMFVYLMSLKPGHFKTYSTPENSFWCCVGTGMENHAKYGDTIYFYTESAADMLSAEKTEAPKTSSADDKSAALYVNLFIPSELTWPEKNLVLRQETKFPESDTTRMDFKCERPTPLALKVRWPEWSENIYVRVNGKKQKLSGNPGSYVSIERQWQNGDRVDIQLSMKLHAEPLPGSTNTVAVLYGPIVLSGNLGTNGLPNQYARNQTDLVRVPDPSVPVFIGDQSSFLKKISATRDPLTFQTKNLGRPTDVTLVPFYLANHERYTIYWKLISEADWKAQAMKLAAEEAARMASEALMVDVVHPAESQSETDHRMQGDETQTGDFSGRKYRHATGWFSYDLKVIPGEAQQLAATFWGGDTGAREFDVLVDDKIIATQQLNNNKPGEFFDAVYPLPPELTTGKQTVRVKFAAHPGNLAGGLFDLRVLRTK
jgi:hypothetical protein